MSSTVFILGAGASVHTGAPVMKDFLNVADQLWKSGKIQDDDKSFEKVFKARSLLQNVHSKSEIDLNNIESLYSIFEMAKILNHFFDYTNKEINNLTNSIQKLIVKTLEQSVKFQIHQERLLCHQEYADFIDILHLLRENVEPKEKVCVITFNYDITLDYALRFKNRAIDYALDSISYEPDITLLKLHGSLNWAQCSKCRPNIFPYDVQKYTNDIRTDITNKIHLHQTEYYLRVGSHIQRSIHDKCGNSAKSTPLIVPPAWNKTIYHNQITNVWNRAAKELSGAENIYVIGYSFPKSDYFFHLLYALGSVGENLLKRFWVFNPNKEDVESRFYNLLGPGARSNFKIFPLKFNHSIILMKKILSRANALPEKISDDLRHEFKHDYY